MKLYDSKFVYFDWDDKLEGKKGFFSDSICDLKRYVKVNTSTFCKEIHHNIDVPSFPFQFINDDGGTCFFKFCYYDPYYEFRKAYLEGKQLQFKDSNGNWRDVEGEPIFTRDEYRIKPKITIWYIVLDDYGLSRVNSKIGYRYIVFEGTEDKCIQWMEKYKKFEDILLAWKEGKPIQYKEGNKWIDWMINPTPPSHDCFDKWKEWRIKPETEYVPFNTVQELIDAWDNKYPQDRPEGVMPLIWIKRKEMNRVYLITDFLFEKKYDCDVGTEDENLKLQELFDDYTFADGSIIGKVKA